MATGTSHSISRRSGMQIKKRKRAREGAKLQGLAVHWLDLSSSLYTRHRTALWAGIRLRARQAWGRRSQKTMVSDGPKRQSFCREEMILKQPVCQWP